MISGGQRQRIALARAFYNIKDILILDEATSALDQKTEKKFTDELKKISKEITVIIVSHRSETLVNCNKVLDLNNLMQS